MNQNNTYEELKRQVDRLKKENDAIRLEKKVIEDSEALYRLTLENISDTVIITDDQGEIIYACPNSRYIFGLSQNQIYAKKTVQNLINGDICDLSKLKTVQEISNIEWKVRDSHGGEHFVLISIKAVSIKSGTVLYVMRDITERKQAEKAWKENEQLVISLLKAIPLAVFFKDREGKYIGCNHVFTEIMGVTEDDIKGKTVYDLWPGEHAKKYHEKDLELIKSREHQEYEFVVQDKNGQIRPVIYMKDVFNNAEGDVAGLVGAFLDITERKEAEMALRESEERFRILFNSAAEGILVAEIASKLFAFANPAMCKILGYSEEELIGMNVMDIHPEESLNHVISEFEAQAKGEKVLAPDTPCKRKDGQIIYTDVNTRKAKIQGVDYNIGFFTDITERKKAEKALRESEAQKKAILDASVDSIRLVDKEMKIIWTNKIVEQLTGRDRNEIIGEFCYKLFTGRDEPCPNCPTMKSIKSGKLEHSIICEENVKGIDGISYWADYAVPVKNESGETENFIQVSRDISELKEAEAELLEEKRKLEIALSHAKKLSGLLPICTHCKKIRDDKGYWNQIESYLEKHSDASLSYSICRECAKKYYPDYDIYND